LGRSQKLFRSTEQRICAPGQFGAQASRGILKELRQSLKLCHQHHGQVTWIAGKNLIATDTAEQHSQSLPCRPADQKRGHRRWIANRFIQMPNQFRQHRFDFIALQVDFVMQRIQFRRHFCSIGPLIHQDIRFQIFGSKADEIGFNSLLAMPGQIVTNRRRVDSTAEEGAEGNVRDGLSLNGSLHRSGDSFERLVAPMGRGLAWLPIPIL